jgi:hypothetical protein
MCCKSFKPKISIELDKSASKVSFLWMSGLSRFPNLVSVMKLGGLTVVGGWRVAFVGRLVKVSVASSGPNLFAGLELC